MMAASLPVTSSFAMPFYLQSGIPIKFYGVVDDTLLVCLESGVGQSRPNRHPASSSGVGVPPQPIDATQALNLFAGVFSHSDVVR